jgi:3-deoxy-D-manno-octulosonic-acid transferase
MGFSLILYNLALLAGAVFLSPVWLCYLLLVPKARAGFWEKLGCWPAPLKTRTRKPKDRQRIWFHAVSVGELNAIKTLIPDLTQDYDVVISTTTQTGHDLAIRTFSQLPVFYFPYDFPVVLGCVIQRIQPDLVIIAETELWPNFIHSVSQRFKTPVILINGRLSQRSYQGYRWVRWLMRFCLGELTHLYMQSQADSDRVQALGQLPAEQITVAGNLKFDLTPTLDATRQAILAHLLNIHADDTVLTFASTHSGEDSLFIEMYLQLKKDFPELKLILAPRHPERLPEIRSLLNARALAYSVRSQLTEHHPNQQDIVVLDSIGELLTVYGFSKIAVMGGSFVEKGGQNPLEPMSQRVPVIFGPHMENFSEIRRLTLENGAGYQANSQTELVQAITQLLTQPEIYDSIAENGQRLLESNRGAKDLILKAIRLHLAEAKRFKI